MTSPTARSLAWLRERHYLVDVVERWIAQAGIRKDLFGFIDLVAVKPGEILGIQTTTASNLAARLKKAVALPDLRAWLAAGGRFMLHGWALRGGRWYCRVLEVQAGDLQPLELLALPRRRGGKGRTQRTLWDADPDPAGSGG